jgi:hypothetical protein
MVSREHRPTGTLLGAAVLAVLAFVAAGCGGSGSAAGSNVSATGASTTTPTTSTTGRSADFQAFSACLKAHGITLPNGGFFGRRPRSGTGTNPQAPPSGGSGAPPRRNLTAQQQKAFDTCRSTLPNGGAFGGGRPGNGAPGGPGGAQSPALARYTQCLKAHGVTFGGSSSPSTFQKAQAACAKYRPSFTPRGGTTTNGS